MYVVIVINVITLKNYVKKYIETIAYTCVLRQNYDKSLLIAIEFITKKHVSDLYICIVVHI